MVMIPTEKCSLAWENFQSNTSQTFQSLRTDNDFHDVTLVCEDNLQIAAHKIVIAASSRLLQKMLRSSKHSNPMIYFWGVKLRDLSSLVDFIYNGQVEVYQSDLAGFLEAASRLDVRGLHESEEVYNKIQSNGSHKELKSLGQTLEEKENSNTNEIFQKYALTIKNEAELDKSYHEESLVDGIKKKKIRKRTNKKSSPIWEFFQEDENDPSIVYCTTCCRKISRGKSGKALHKMTPHGMKTHLRTKHLQQWDRMCKIVESNQQSIRLANDTYTKHTTAAESVEVDNSFFRDIKDNSENEIKTQQTLQCDKYSGQLCSFRSETIEDLKIHIIITKHFLCDTCNSTFICGSDLDQHLWDEHKVIPL